MRGSSPRMTNVVAVRRLFPFQADLDRRAVADGLIDHAIALGELEQLIELVLRRIAVDVEAQANLRKADRRVLGDAEGAAEIEIALGRHGAGLERDIERGCHRLQGDAGAGDQRFEQHVAGAQFEPAAAGGGMQPGDRERAAGLDLAGDVGIVERALGLERDDGGLRRALVALLDRRLQRAQCGGVHDFLLLTSSWPGSSRPSTSSIFPRLKTWMPGTRPGMTNIVQAANYHHSAAPVLVLASPSAGAAARLSERSSAASTRRLTKSKAADCRSRGRGRSTSMSSNTRPGRGHITMTRSASTIASSTSWVTRIKVGLASAHRSSR